MPPNPSPPLFFLAMFRSPISPLLMFFFAFPLHCNKMLILQTKHTLPTNQPIDARLALIGRCSCRCRRVKSARRANNCSAHFLFRKLKFELGNWAKRGLGGGRGVSRALMGFSCLRPPPYAPGVKERLPAYDAKPRIGALCSQSSISI